MLAKQLNAHSHPGAANGAKGVQEDLGKVFWEDLSLVQLPFQTFFEYETDVGYSPMGPLNFG